MPVPVTFNKPYWEQAVTEVEIRAARSLDIPDTQAASKAAQTFNITYAPSWWDWSAHNTTIIHNAPGERSSRKEDKESERADRAKVIGFLVSLGAALFTGIFCSSFSSARSALHLTERRIDVISFYSDSSSLKRPLHTLFAEQREIEMRNYAAARDKLLSAVVILAGGVSTLAGGFMVSSALITAGYAAMAFGAIALLLSIGLHWSDKSANQEHAYRIVGYKYQQRHIEGLAETARRELCHYDDQMMYVREEGEPYAPLYGEGQLPQYVPATCQPSAPGEGETA